MELLGGIQRMEHAIQTPVGDPAWRPAMSRAVAQLKAAFAEQVSGLYAEVLDDAPWVAPYLDDLAGRHRSVRTALDELEGRLRDPGTDEDVRWEADRLIREVWQYRQKGADLLYEAYETDLGGET
ncbi:hypothetical protein AB0M46_06150 [Dactylosporangium sp. NPDC051485]|uniref:hypothetical protein n=1 Tax=Dactylosporangium sp. NPDC051485 TaxID=3154846 RepID=UPI003445C8CC